MLDKHTLSLRMKSNGLLRNYNNNCLETVNLLPLHQRREKICHQFIKRNESDSPTKAILNRPKNINNHGTTNCSTVK